MRRLVFVLWIVACQSVEQPKKETLQEEKEVVATSEAPSSVQMAEPETQDTTQGYSQQEGQSQEAATAQAVIDEEAQRILNAPIEEYSPLKDDDPEPDPDPDEFILVDRDPQCLNVRALKNQIRYPKQLEGSGIKGKVYLKVLISKKGFYRGHIVKRSPHPLLTNAVVEQLKKIRCKPALRNGKPVKVWIHFVYEFK